MEVRRARVEDAESIASLLGELDYPTDPRAVAGRLERLLDGSEHGVLVATDVDRPVSVLSFQIIELLERPAPVCRITSLVTAAGRRRRGAARALLAAVRGLAEERGCGRLEVTTKPERTEALALYLGAGFVERPRRLVLHLAD